MPVSIENARVLTVRQPYASLIIYGGKEVENRSQPTRFRGRLYIHAGAAMHEDAPNLELEPAMQLTRRAIIGYVQLIDCVRNSRSQWAEPGMWHWLLADPVPLARRIPAQGKLGLWYPPEGLS
jgi:hypothetical protein